jgi:DNA-directed RNA polymerase subunit RPC12/RpoP
MLDQSNTNIQPTGQQRNKGTTGPTGERYKLDCHRCRRTVEIPVENVQAGVGACPRCSVRLTILWNAVHAQTVGLKRVSA